MPEAAVDENHSLVFWENQVWFPRKILPMQAKSVPMGMKRPAYSQLGLGVTTPDPGHQLTSFGRRESIYHPGMISVWKLPSDQDGLHCACAVGIVCPDSVDA